MPRPSFHFVSVRQTPRQYLDLLNPTGPLAQDPEAVQTAYALNSHPAFNYDQNPGRLAWQEFQGMLADPYVHPHAKQVLWRIHPYFFADSPDDRTVPLQLGAQILTQLQSQIDRFPPGSEDRQALESLSQTRSLAGLRSDEQMRLVRVVGGTNEHISGKARAQLVRLLRSQDFAASPVGAQIRQLRAFLGQQPWLDFDMTPQGSFDGMRARVDLSEPEEISSFEFRDFTILPDGGCSDRKVSVAALKYEVTTANGAAVDIIVPKEVDSSFWSERPSIAQMAQTIGVIPKECAHLVNQVVIHPIQTSAPGFMTNDAGRIEVWSGGSDGLECFGRVLTQTDYDAAFIHEVGHLLTVEGWQVTWDDNDPRWDPWKSAMMKDGLSPSKYATFSPAEDSAETFRLLLSVRGSEQEEEIRALFPERFRTLEQLIAAA